MNTIFDLPGKEKDSTLLPVDTQKEFDPIPEKYLNKGINLLQLGETDVVRHYTKLSTYNIGVDTAMYPLGSCTMKYNPKINERTASLEGFSLLHPFSSAENSQGSLRLIHQLTHFLNVITGMSDFSLIPAAGAHGELSSAMIIRKYFESIGENRRTILIPDTAHGTNPASVAMCGFTIKEVLSNSSGDVDLAELEKLLDNDVAAMMLTSPSTLGLFDRNIKTISKMLHDKGALFYCDGANLNAVLGKARVADMGFDIMHINLHKTFSTPHGGGGPGAGPVGVVEKLIPFLPVPKVEESNGKYFLNYDKPHSIGMVHSFYGNFLILVRAYTYILSLGAKGIREAGEHAVLNANYLLSVLKESYHLPFKRKCMHEFVLSDEGLPNDVTTNDISKRILDYGFHSPTVYFPLLVHGAIMIEPTETENKHSLDLFAQMMRTIRNEINETPDLVKSAPVHTPVRRVDAVVAARKPILKHE